MLNPWVGLQNTLVVLFVPGRNTWYETVDPLVGRYEDLKLLDVGTYNQFCRSSSGWLWAPRIMLYGFRAKSYNGFGTNNWSGQIQRPQQSANYNLRPVRGPQEDIDPRINTRDRINLFAPEGNFFFDLRLPG